PRSELQLLGAACLFVASKLGEVNTPTIDWLVEISDRSYTAEQVTSRSCVCLDAVAVAAAAAASLTEIDAQSLRLNSAPAAAEHGGVDCDEAAVRSVSAHPRVLLGALPARQRGEPQAAAFGARTCRWMRNTDGNAILTTPACFAP